MHPKSASPLPARPPAIVLVEDEPDILIILHRIVRDLDGGHDIITVRTGVEALAQVALRAVPLLITDYSMSGMNGIQLADAVKQESPDTTVVLITGYMTPEIIQRATAAHANYVLPKPFPFDQLMTIIRRTLE